MWGPIGLITLFFILVGAGAGAAYGVYRSFADDLVEPEAILATQRALGTSRIFDRDGEDGILLFEFADPLSGLRSPIKFENVSPFLINATVATEDASFFENNGLNTRGLLRATWENLGFGGSDFLGGSGGSSITQQLVKNVLIPQEERSGRTRDRIEAKIRESILAVELTDRFPKTQIMEWYLNSIFYGNLSYGVGAASQRYFGKSTADLTLPEAALLAGMPQAPAIFDPFTNLGAAKDRQAQVLDLMARQEYITQAEADEAKRAPLNFGSQSFDILAPHFVLYVRDQVVALCERGRFELPSEVQDCSEILTQGGLRVTTTIDMDLQRLAEETVRADIATFEEQTGARNAALVAIDPKNGEILVMVGSRDFFREDIDGQVNLATGLNSPGSSFKPITYAAAFLLDPALWNPATIVWDVDTEFQEFDGTTFSPENFDNVLRGPVPIRSALANSMNIPAFRVATALGIDYLLEAAHQFGITTLVNPRNYGPSITLGGGDVSLLDMTYVYSGFANNGVLRGHPTLAGLPSSVVEEDPVVAQRFTESLRAVDPIAIKEIRDTSGRLLFRQDGFQEERVLPAPQAFQITSILSDNNARAILYGLNSNLVLDRPAAAKTGTAGDPGRNDVRRDFWTMGYTPDLVTGVWVGNADNTPMTGGSSSRTAGLIWRDFMLAAHEGMAPSEFAIPPGLTTSEVFVPRIQTLGPGQERDDLEPQNPCTSPIRELFVEDGGVPAKENNICEETRIDSRTLLLATDETPETYVEEGFFLIPPIVEGAEEPDEEIIKWLRLNKVQYVGDEDSSEDAVPVRLDSPIDGAELGSGFVLVRGRARSDELKLWTLSFAPGVQPADDEFVILARSRNAVESGELGRWNTRSLEPGAYVLRLLVEDGFRGDLIIEARVTIGGDPIPTSADDLLDLLETVNRESGDADSPEGDSSDGSGDGGEESGSDTEATDATP